MYSIKRNIEEVLKSRAQNSKAILLTGPRQVGKSTLFKHLFSNVNQISLDEDMMLAQAIEDPQMFLYNNPCPLMIDEVQKAPKIFSRIKMVLDDTDKYSNYFLTGSQKIQLMDNVSESLAGRISIMELEGLSMREINNISFNKHFLPTKDYIVQREKDLVKYKRDIWTIIHRGFYPELYANDNKSWIDFYQSYVKTYLERDVNKILKVKNYLAFLKFMTSVAARTGQILNYKSISNDVGVSEVTIKEWIGILEKSGLVYILKPYTSNVLTRAIKSPKIYFRDTGLACYLTRWLTSDVLKSGAMAGNMFETFVVNEILKSYTNEGLDYDFSVFYYNGKDKIKKKIDGQEVFVDGEIDLVILENGTLYPIEIKLTANPKADMASEFDILDKVKQYKRGMGAIICLYDKKMYLKENLVVLPIDYI